MPIQAMVPTATQTITAATAAAAMANPFNERQTVVRLISDVACHVAFGASPTATTGDMLMAANREEYFCIPAGGTTKISAIKKTGESDGTLYITTFQEE